MTLLTFWTLRSTWSHLPHGGWHSLNSSSPFSLIPTSLSSSDILFSLTQQRSAKRTTAVIGQGHRPAADDSKFTILMLPPDSLQPGTEESVPSATAKRSTSFEATLRRRRMRVGTDTMTHGRAHVCGAQCVFTGKHILHLVVPRPAAICRAYRANTRRDVRGQVDDACPARVTTGCGRDYCIERLTERPQSEWRFKFIRPNRLTQFTLAVTR